MTMRRRLARCTIAVLALAMALPAAAASSGISLIKTEELREWLTYIASDELQGRATFGTGLGLAAAYIEDHLKAWGVKPAGDGGSYLQTVRVVGVKSTSHSTVTVQVGDETRTFRDDGDVLFPRNAGARQSLTLDRVEFVGYGLDVPAIHHVDMAGKALAGAAVVWLGPNGPRGFDRSLYRTLLAYRNPHITDELRGAAVVGPLFAPRPQNNQQPQAANGRSRAAGSLAPDFTTTRRLDLPRAPAIQASDAFYSFLLSKAPVKYDELKRMAEAQDPLPSFRLDGVKITFNVDNDYEVVRTQLTQNIVAIVEGTDPQLKATYVAFGAHYDHVGYSEAPLSPNGTRAPPPNGLVGSGPADDIIWNGADDDGSGTVALMALAEAYEQGPRPKRSMLFVWHAGEELGTYGSLYFADHPTVPLSSIAAQLNIDMIGRNRNDDSREGNTVYLVGSDRISTELDQIAQSANLSLAPPLALNYDMNDPSEPEQIYYRSDHYSYAAKGIPVIFFTTGLHPDYHASTDEVSRILFDKLARVTGLVYETGDRLANLTHMPARDDKGPRATTPGGTP